MFTHPYLASQLARERRREMLAPASAWLSGLVVWPASAWPCWRPARCPRPRSPRTRRAPPRSAPAAVTHCVQANTKILWTASGPGTGQSLGLGMKAGTSPAITALPGGGYEAAFQANTGHLWVVQNGAGQDLGLGMKAGTSPAITALPGGGYEAAFRPTAATCGSSATVRARIWAWA